MVMDVERFSQKRDALLCFGVEHKFHFPALDQGLLLKFFEGSIDKLPDEWNWKAYWGWQKKKKTNIRIAHFHGPKPRGVYGWVLPVQIQGLLSGGLLRIQGSM